MSIRKKGRFFVSVKSVVAGLGTAVAGAMLVCGTASASLIGQDVRFQCTNCVPPTNDVFTVVQGGGPELSLFDSFTVDVEESSLRIDWIVTSPAIALEFVWSDLDWGVPGDILNATIDPSSTWSLADTPTFTGSSVTLNSTDLDVVSGDFLIINLDVPHTSVSEPSMLALFSFGLLGLGISRRRRNR